jgi:nucleoside-diphosphate-sugar epimerase
MTRSEAGSRRLIDRGAGAELANALDTAAVTAAVRRARPEVVIDQLSSLPQDPADMDRYLPDDVRLRLEGGANLRRAALDCGARRYVQQSSGFFLKPGKTLADESESMALDASPGIATSARLFAALEHRASHSEGLENVLLRYGAFYGPNTWYRPDGAVAGQVRRRQLPVIGDGRGVWSFVHVEDAALATVAALSADPGVYHIVDDDPAPARVWLPRFARWVGAPAPPGISILAAREAIGADAAYCQNKLRGASNAKARRCLGFRPRPLEWLQFERAAA